MRKFLAILFILPVFCQGQTNGNINSLPGEILVPALQSIKVELVIPTPLSFETPDDLKSPKMVPGLYRITVTSNVPWVVTVASSTPFLMAYGNNKIPSSAVELRGNTGNFFPLSITPVTILKSTNERIQNIFYIDVKMKAEVVHGSGNFSGDLRFSIAPE